ncbi:MAG: hydrogenase iron-sulfur subunit, partial [Candidatus Electrothrix sp. AX5]|nr:hydrogenase iron-sulfur subunit [Candidatus Electrothrix sp. AX5]
PLVRFIPVRCLGSVNMVWIKDAMSSGTDGVLSSNKGKINRSAEAAGVSTRQLHKLMRKYGLKREEFRR